MLSKLFCIPSETGSTQIGKNVRSKSFRVYLEEKANRKSYNYLPNLKNKLFHLVNNLLYALTSLILYL